MRTMEHKGILMEVHPWCNPEPTPAPKQQTRATVVSRFGDQAAPQVNTRPGLLIHWPAQLRVTRVSLLTFPGALSNSAAPLLSKKSVALLIRLGFIELLLKDLVQLPARTVGLLYNGHDDDSLT